MKRTVTVLVFLFVFGSALFGCGKQCRNDSADAALDSMQTPDTGIDQLADSGSPAESRPEAKPEPIVIVTLNGPPKGTIKVGADDAQVIRFTIFARHHVEIRHLPLRLTCVDAALGNCLDDGDYAVAYRYLKDIKVMDLDRAVVVSGPLDIDQWKSTGIDERSSDYFDRFEILAGTSVHLQVSLDVSTDANTLERATFVADATFGKLGDIYDMDTGSDIGGPFDVSSDSIVGGAQTIEPCALGSSHYCYDGPPGTEGVGRCIHGMRMCEMGKGGPEWSFGCYGEYVPNPFGDICGNATDDDCNGFKDDSALAVSVAGPMARLMNGVQVVHRFSVSTSTAATKSDIMAIDVENHGVTVGMYQVEMNGADITDKVGVLSSDGVSLDLKTTTTSAEHYQFQIVWAPDFWVAPTSHTDNFVVRAMVSEASDGDSLKHWFQWKEVICSVDTGTMLSF